MRLIDEPLEEGDSYSVRAYVPDPSAERMRAAPDAWHESLRSYVAFSLPRPGETALDAAAPGELRAARAGRERPAALPFRGEPTDDASTAQTVARDPRVAVRAHVRAGARLAAGQPTTYDVVRTTER